MARRKRRDSSGGQVVNAFASFSETKRELKSGKTQTRNKVDVSFSVERPAHVNLDPMHLAAMGAEAIRDDIQEQITGIKETVSPETLERRQRANRAWFNNPSKALRKRYSGGRIGPLPPGDGPYYLNDSGRMANHLAARARVRSSGEAVVTLNVPNNRSDALANPIVQDKLKQHVSWFGGTSSKNNQLLDQIGKDTAEAMHSFSEIDAYRKALETAKAVINLLRAFGQFA